MSQTSGKRCWTSAEASTPPAFTPAVSGVSWRGRGAACGQSDAFWGSRVSSGSWSTCSSVSQRIAWNSRSSYDVMVSASASRRYYQSETSVCGRRPLVGVTVRQRGRSPVTGDATASTPSSSWHSRTTVVQGPHRARHDRPQEARARLCGARRAAVVRGCRRARRSSRSGVSPIRPACAPGTPGLRPRATARRSSGGSAPGRPRGAMAPTSSRRCARGRSVRSVAGTRTVWRPTLTNPIASSGVALRRRQ